MNPELELSKMFGRCQNPRVIINRYTGKPVLVSCGHCSNCLNHKCDRNSLLCEIQSQLYKYVYFVTLTYANQYIPLFELYDSSDLLTSENAEKRQFIARCVSPRLRQLVDADLFSVTARPGFIASLAKKVNLGGRFGFSYLPDLQNFIKRLRSYYDYHTELDKNEIKYFATSEYGPVHYRPHYHLLLFSNSDVFAENIHEAVNKCWKFGRIDCQLADSRCGNYLASYVNSFSELPFLFKNKVVKPFTSHSCYFASLLPVLDKNSLYENPYEYISKTLYPVHGKMLPLPLFRSTFSVILPKIVGFTNKDFYQLYYDYTSYLSFSKYLKLDSPTPADLARAVLDDNLITDIYVSSFRDYMSRQMYDYGYHDADKRFVFFYNYFNTSKKFLDYVCDNDLTLVRSRLRTLIDYYNRCDYERLKSWYKLQEYASRRSDYDYRHYYYADLRKSPIIFSSDYKDSISVLSYYRASSQKNDRECKFRVKHKRLNDANKIFNLDE